MAEKEITSIAELDKFIADNKVVVADFYADWCGPCKRIAPYVHKKSHETGIALAKVNVDTAGDVAAKYKIESMPTFAVLNAGGSLLTKVGGSEGVVNEIFAKAASSK